MIYEAMNGKNAGQTIKESQTWSKCRKWGAYPQLIYLQQPVHHKFRKHYTEVGVERSCEPEEQDQLL